MAQLYKTRPSRLLTIDDPYEAWCLDEAIADYTGRIRTGSEPRAPGKPTEPVPGSNAALLRQLTGKRNRR